MEVLSNKRLVQHLFDSFPSNTLDAQGDLASLSEANRGRLVTMILTTLGHINVRRKPLRITRWA